MMIGRLSFWWCAVLMACGQLPACAQLFLVASPSATNGSASGFVALGWNSSPDTSVTGYFVGWGLSSDACTNLLDAGSATSVTVAGLAANVTYYFTVVAYDNAGDQSPPSNVVMYAPGSVVSYAPGSALSIQPTSGGNAPGLSLSFQGQAGVVYSLQATMDFTNWVTIFTTNCPAAGPVAFQVTDMASYPRRFYRVRQQ